MIHTLIVHPPQGDRWTSGHLTTSLGPSLARPKKPTKTPKAGDYGNSRLSVAKPKGHRVKVYGRTDGRNVSKCGRFSSTMQPSNKLTPHPTPFRLVGGRHINYCMFKAIHRAKNGNGWWAIEIICKIRMHAGDCRAQRIHIRHSQGHCQCTWCG